MYKATIRTDDGDMRTYTGCTDRKFKEDYTSTEQMRTIGTTDPGQKCLHISGIKRTGGIGIQDVRYNIVKKCHPYLVGRDRCDVCLSKKLAIMKGKDTRSMNKRTEFMNKCRHKWRQKLAGKKTL